MGRWRGGGGGGRKNCTGRGRGTPTGKGAKTVVPHVVRPLACLSVFVCSVYEALGVAAAAAGAGGSSGRRKGTPCGSSSPNNGGCQHVIPASSCRISAQTPSLARTLNAYISLPGASTTLYRSARAYRGAASGPPRLTSCEGRKENGQRLLGPPSPAQALVGVKAAIVCL